MKLFAFLFGGTLATLAAADILSDCSGAAAHLKGLELNISPMPPTKGADLSISITGTLDEDLTGGSIDVWVKFLGIKVVNQVWDLCNEAAKRGMACPIPAGASNFTFLVNLPAATPDGHYTGKAIMADQNSQQITCATMAIEL
jgi:hypothetical protein